MTTAAKNFITEIGRVQAVFTGKQPSKQDAFEACVLGPFSTTEHLTRVKACHLSITLPCCLAPMFDASCILSHAVSPAMAIHIHKAPAC